MFPHHCNRNGEPHIHIHLLFLNRVQTLSDGHWRAADGRSIFRSRGSGSAIGALALETGLTQRCGFAWVHRPKSHGRVIQGVPDKLITAFSSRRAQIDKVTLGMVERFREERGAEPDPTGCLEHVAGTRTTSPRRASLRARSTLSGSWRTGMRRAVPLRLGSLVELAQSMWGGSAQAEARLKRAGELSPKAERELMLKALAEAQQSQAVFGRHVLIHRLGEHLPDYVIAHGRDHAQALLESLADRILAGRGWRPRALRHGRRVPARARLSAPGFR